ncbi:hypothetical protein ACFQ1S_00180 [Kibdelosporangium lantanae]|uniref:Uncharacterized protein n=1 Tax=Kibdelosporangium lantanae TaxID=1497396 RepID=A0ABW3M0E0_9PSEU
MSDKGTDADVPGRHDRKWDTPRPEKVVVGLARTLTSFLRVRELLNFAFGGDSHIRLVYVFDDGSAFRSWRAEWSAWYERVIWAPDEVRALQYDLVVTASENVDFRRWSGPILVIPHGLGNHKTLPRAAPSGTALSGLPDPAALRTGRVTLVVTHPNQAAQLHQTCPETIGHTVVAGDTSLAILLASNEPRHVELYRKVLGTSGRKLVLVMSTWGNDSMLGAEFDVLLRLVAELPLERFQVGLVAHCNIWSRDGADELLRKVDKAMAAGLVLIKPGDWHAALAAAHLVISDHGSCSLYAAMLGKPLLLGSFSDTEVVRDTPMFELGRVMPRLDLSKPIQPQVQAAIVNADPASAAEIRRTVVAPIDSGVQQLRRLLYRLLRLVPQTVDEEVDAAPPPDPVADPVCSWLVTGKCRRRKVKLSLFPARAGSVRTSESFWVSTERERKPRIFNKSSVIFGPAPFGGGMDAWLSQYNGHPYKIAALAAGDGKCIAQVSDLGPYANKRYVLTSKNGTLPFEMLPAVLLVAMISRQPHKVTGSYTITLGPIKDTVVVKRVKWPRKLDALGP